LTQKWIRPSDTYIKSDKMTLALVQLLYCVCRRDVNLPPPSLSLCLSLSFNLSIYPSIYLSLLSIYLSICISIHPSIYLSIYQSVYLSIHPSIYPSLSLISASWCFYLFTG